MVIINNPLAPIQNIRRYKHGHQNYQHNQTHQHNQFGFQREDVSDGRHPRQSNMSYCSFPSMVYRLPSQPNFSSSSSGNGHE